MKIDFWYGNKLKEANFVSVSFYPEDCTYRGNIYKNGRAIADFSSKDSIEIEKYFPGIFK